MTRENTTHSQRIILAVLLISLGVLSGVWAVALVQRQPTPVGPSASEPAPVAIKPSTQEIADYKVAPDLPKYVTIPAINVNKIRIVQLGITNNSKLAVPDNIYDAGWYKSGAKPGQDGAMFVYGHVSSWEANGAFHDLKRLEPGDIVTITRGDDHDFNYKIIRSETYPANSVPMDKVLLPMDGSAQGLNLMTCSGHVIKGSNDFTERLVVYANLVQD